MSARETAELLLQVGRLVQAEGYDGELSPALMDGAPLLRPCQLVLTDPPEKGLIFKLASHLGIGRHRMTEAPESRGDGRAMFFQGLGSSAGFRPESLAPRRRSQGPRPLTRCECAPEVQHR